MCVDEAKGSYDITDVSRTAGLLHMSEVPLDGVAVGWARVIGTA